MTARHLIETVSAAAALERYAAASGKPELIPGYLASLPKIERAAVKLFFTHRDSTSALLAKKEN